MTHILSWWPICSYWTCNLDDIIWFNVCLKCWADFFSTNSNMLLKLEDWHGTYGVWSCVK